VLAYRYDLYLIVLSAVDLQERSFSRSLVEQDPLCSCDVKDPEIMKK